MRSLLCYLIICCVGISGVVGEWCGNEDCYDILRVTQRATLDEIKKSYKKLSMQFHPDKNPTASQERFKLIARAYEILSDTRKRQRYDYAIRNPDGWIDEDGNYNDQPGSMDYNMVSIGLLVGCVFFLASAKWVTSQEFWSKSPVKTKKSKKSAKKQQN